MYMYKSFKSISMKYSIQLHKKKICLTYTKSLIKFLIISMYNKQIRVHTIDRHEPTIYKFV